jgi:AraC-like DNA-binding protein
MDALAAALGSVRVTGAVFFDAVCRAPWGFAVPAMESAAPLLSPESERLVGYHLVAEGRAVVSRKGAQGVPVAAGDIVVFPHGDPHIVSNGAPARLIDSAELLGSCLAGELSTMRLGDEGEATRLVCGYFGCERHAARLFLAGLPTMIKLNIRGDDAGRWLESSIRHLLSEAASERPGRTALLCRVAEALFIETLRRHMEGLPSEQTGWLAGARDPVVGAALALLHRSTSHPWTLTELASKTGTSRSVLAERFARYLGEPPLAYLARWRLQLAARKLQTTEDAIMQVAWEVGYESEAAFNRAFKREFGLPPGQYRRKLASGVEAEGEPPSSPH